MMRFLRYDYDAQDDDDGMLESPDYHMPFCVVHSRGADFATSRAAPMARERRHAAAAILCRIAGPTRHFARSYRRA